MGQGGKGCVCDGRQWRGREDEFSYCLFQDLERFLTALPQTIEITRASYKLLHYSKTFLNAHDIKVIAAGYASCGNV